ncbi:MAG: HDOD domain-containing protein [Gammaproteobacteria bacterium]|nr:HDOD domain-containing protein [Gammaproteobacteria bacterium]
MQVSEDFRATAFKFVQQLAVDLSNDEFDLPGFPDVVMRLHKVLADESSSVGDIVKLVNSEPALLARLIQLAGSAAFNANGRQITGPQAAIQRLGFNVVRGTATTFAMAQMRDQDWLQPVRPQLASIWRRSNSVASTCYALAEVLDGVRSDEALAAGLFHQMGNLYLFARAHKEGLPVANNPEWDEIIIGWHPTITRAILENWKMPESIAEAAENQDAVFDEGTSELTSLPMLTRLLSAAKLYDMVENEPQLLQPGWKELLVDVRLNGYSFTELLEAGREKIATVSQSMS